MKKTYGSAEIQRIAKISKMQAIHWTQTGVVKPLEDAQGRGSKRVYSWENLIEMMICRELNYFKIERRLMAIVVDRLNQPFKETDSYWQYLRQNPKTEALYLLVSIGKEGEKFWHDGDKLHKGYMVVILNKKALPGFVEINSNYLIVNIGILISEAKG